MSKNVKMTVDGEVKTYNGISTVQIPTAEGGTAEFKDVDEITTPSGSVNITENGTHDVSAYAQAVVNVESGGDSTDNYEDFVKLLISYRETALDENLYFTVPDGVTILRTHAFSSMYPVEGDKLLVLTLPDSILEFKNEVFNYNNNITIGKLPPNIKKIGTQCFQYANRLFAGTELEIPESVETIDNLAFYRCDSATLATITFKGTPTSIAQNAFQGCIQITAINVPWAEGDVANAPWGATNATINYNYTGT